MNHADTTLPYPNAAYRMVSLFKELLESQFPAGGRMQQPLKLKTPRDYAEQLSVHVNYLNHVIKQVTGKTTTENISDRIMEEAKSLLLRTNWHVHEIAWSLGFEYVSYFNRFFRKQLHMTPSAFRLLHKD